ncbi:MAG: hypothetical protein H6741_09250 [Alphaproteobacteria bacterium]|nr:hypothetical protein [Alphaproteobacteria bacterium]MCB9792900.1 hypothetical protein [Alphaproteobacteria bacterium]
MIPALLLLACAEPVVFSPREISDILEHSPLPELPADPTNAVGDAPEAAWLGQALFYDTRLSANGEVSCASCHDPALGFSDGLPRSEALGTTRRHAPTLWNASYQRWFYWDGRKDSQWSQALSPIEDADEHGLTRVEVLRLLVEDEALAAAYEGLFGPLPDTEGLPERARPLPEDPDAPEALAWDRLDADTQRAVNEAFANVGKALAAYQRQLISRDAPFDALAEALAAGDETGGEALSESAKRGLRLFVGEANCAACHSGPFFSNRDFHNIGLGPREWLDPEDLGRWDGVVEVLEDPFNGQSAYSDDPEGEAGRQLTSAYQAPEYLGAFKTPGLREVAHTAPYMHGGHFETLTEVVEHYNAVQELPVQGHREELLLPLGLSDRDIADLVAFLESLSGAPLDEALLQPLL